MSPRTIVFLLCTLGACGGELYAQISGPLLAPTIRSTRYDKDQRQAEAFEHPSYQPGPAGTVEFWMLREERTNSVPFGSFEGLWFFFNLDDEPDTLRLSLGFEDPVFTTLTRVDVPLAQWCHVAVSYETRGDGSAFLANIYVNGAHADVFALQGTIRTDASDIITLGTMTGRLDEIRVWDHARSSREIADNYLREIRSEAGLVAVFPNGGGHELIQDVRPRPIIDGSIGTPDTFGVLPTTSAIPPLSTASPLVDGVIDRFGEYGGVEAAFSMRYGVPLSADATVTMVHAGGNLFAAIHGLQRPPDPTADHTLDVYLRRAEEQDPLVPPPDPFGLRIDLRSGSTSGLEQNDEGEWVACQGGGVCPPAEDYDAAMILGNDGLLSVEIRLARSLLGGLVEPCFRVGFSHVGWNGLCPNADDPLRVTAPFGVEPSRPETWSEVAFLPETPGGDGTCDEPIEIAGADLPIREMVFLDEAVNSVEGLPCLRSPMPGPDTFVRFSVPQTGDYSVATMPADSQANIAIALLSDCRPESCLAATDDRAPGAGEVLTASLEADRPYLLLIDSAPDLNGNGPRRIDLYIDRADRPPKTAALHVVRAEGVATPQITELQEHFTEVWSVDSIGVAITGLATDEQVDVLETQASVDMLQVDRSSTQAQPQPQPPPFPPPSLHFDRFLYGFDEGVQPCFYLYTEKTGLDPLQEIWVSSSKTGDVERVELEDNGDGFSIVEPMFLPFVEEDSDVNDGQLSVTPGDQLFAFWFDPRGSGEPEEIATAHAMVAGREDDPAIVIEVDEGLSIPTPSVPGRAPGESPRPIAAMSDGQVELLFGLDQVIFTPRDDADRQRFEDRWGATLVDDGTYPGGEDDGKRPLLYRVDLDSAEVAEMEHLLGLLGAEGDLVVSSPGAATLLGILAEEALRGSVVSPNLILLPSTQPRTVDLLNTDNNAFRAPFAAACTQGMQRAWLTAALMDIDIPAEERDTEHIAVGVIDTNFCPDIANDVEVLGGFDFVEGTPDPFGMGETFGFGGRFHGTLMAHIIGAKHNNGRGVAGTGGQVAALRLYNVGGLSFLHDVAKAIRMATGDGCGVVSMSIGVPCKIAGLNFCNPWTSLACPFIAAGLQAALQAVLAHAPVAPALPVDALATFLCFTLVAVLSDAEDSLEDALSYATSRGTICIASAGNKTDPFGEASIQRFHVIPAILRNCVSVGAADLSHDNQHIFGASVDVWAIERVESTGPHRDSTSCTPFESRIANGTSAACAEVAGVVALMRAANPHLTPSELTGILRSTSVRSPAPAFDPRVRRFLRADLALEAAFASPPVGRNSPSLVSELGFDEFNDLASAEAASSCIPPALRRLQNDTRASARRFDPPAEGETVSYREVNHALHDYTIGGSLEHDFFVIDAVETARRCEAFEVRLETGSHTESGIVRPVVNEAEARTVTSHTVDPVRTASAWASKPVFLRDDLFFEVGGTNDDSTYELSVDIRSLGAPGPDVLEPNNLISEATQILPGDFTRTVGSTIDNEILFRDLGFHCPHDVDRFHIVLPDEVEDCLDFQSTCGLGSDHTSSSYLLVTLGEASGVWRDDNGNLLGEGSTLRLDCPRTNGIDDVFVEVPCDGRNATEYQLRALYSVPVNAQETIDNARAIDDRLCCFANMLPGCGGDPGDPPQNAAPETIGVDRWNPHTEVSRDYIFSAFCPDAVCNLGPAIYHAVQWPEGAPLEAAFEAATASTSTSFRMDLLDANFQTVASAFAAAPSRAGGGAGGGIAVGGGGGVAEPECDTSSIHWRLDAPPMTPGLWILRVSGLDVGDIYQLSNLNPLPQVEPPDGAALEFAPESAAEVCTTSDIHLFVQSDEPVSAYQLGVEWDAALVESIEFTPGPDIAPDDVLTFVVQDSSSANVASNQATIGLILQAGVTYDATTPLRALTVRLRLGPNARPGNRIRLCPVDGVGSPVVRPVVSVERDGNTVSTTPALACGDAVVIADRTPPTLECPEDIEVELPVGSDVIAVDFAAQASDLCGSVDVDSTPAPGALFPLGETVVTCTATDAAGNTSECRFVVRVERSGVLFRRGDANDDTSVDISDPVQILNFLFAGGLQPPCMDAADANDDNSVDISDPVQILNFLFAGALPPPSPGPAVCGLDPTPSGLADCVTSACP